MKIGYDAKRAFHNKTGLGNYSRSLIDSMLKHYPNNKYTLYNPKPSRLYLPNNASLSIVQPKNIFNKSFSSLWRSFSINNSILALDIFHGLSHELPFGKKGAKTKWVLTVHDLIFLRYPNYFKAIDRAIYSFKLKYACQKADVIIAISEQTKRDLLHFLEIAEDKIKVIYQTCNPIFKKQISADIRADVSRKYGLPQDFLLQVGTIEERKNLLLSIKALPFIPLSYKLVVVGKKTKYFDEVCAEIDRLQLRERVLILDTMMFNDLPAVYQQSKIFLYPSRYEGFGIPIIEALNCGVPVIAATGSCLEEAGGPGSFYTNPDNPLELAGKINLLLKDDIRMQVIEKGFNYVKRFDEESVANELMMVYQEVIQ